MCLTPSTGRDRYPSVLPDGRVKAWKVVRRRSRLPLHRPKSGVVYKRGTTHTVPLAKIKRGKLDGEYYDGLHVFTSRQSAEDRAYSADMVVIAVQVDPKDWIASNAKEALYKKLKVLT
jgi:hypothetical protein